MHGINWDGSHRKWHEVKSQIDEAVVWDGGAYLLERNPVELEVNVGSGVCVCADFPPKGKGRGRRVDLEGDLSFGPFFQAASDIAVGVCPVEREICDRNAGIDKTGVEFQVEQLLTCTVRGEDALSDFFAVLL